MDRIFRQFDVCSVSNGNLVVIVQSDMLAEVGTRVVVPLFLPNRAGGKIRHLNPEIMVGDRLYVLMPQMTSAMRLSQLLAVIGNVSSARDQITRALDTLLSGV